MLRYRRSGRGITASYIRHHTMLQYCPRDKVLQSEKGQSQGQHQDPAAARVCIRALPVNHGCRVTHLYNVRIEPSKPKDKRSLHGVFLFCRRVVVRGVDFAFNDLLGPHEAQVWLDSQKTDG